MGGGGREQIAAVKRPGDGLERVRRVRELARLDDAAELLGGRNEESVVGPHVDAPLAVAQSQRPARAADPGIDDGEMDPDRHVRQRVRERQGPLKHLPRGHAVRDVDDLDVGSNALDDAVAGPDQVVLQPEVRQERDEARRHGARAYPAASRTAATSTTSSPSGGGSGRSRRVRYTGRNSAPSSATINPRASSAPTKRTRPAGRGNSATSASCEGADGMKSTWIPNRVNAAAVAAPIAATLCKSPRQRRASCSAPFA